MSDTDENRIAELEITLSHQQQEIHDLSDMVNTLRKEVDALKARLESTQGRLVAIEDSVSEGGKGQSTTEFAESQKPPHY